MEDHDRRFCDERHHEIHLWMAQQKKDMETLFNRLNWFYVIAIATLVSSVMSLARGGL
jgi:hypothetical protein